MTMNCAVLSVKLGVQSVFFHRRTKVSVMVLTPTPHPPPPPPTANSLDQAIRNILCTELIWQDKIWHFWLSFNQRYLDTLMSTPATLHFTREATLKIYMYKFLCCCHSGDNLVTPYWCYSTAQELVVYFLKIVNGSSSAWLWNKFWCWFFFSVHHV